MAHKHGGDVYTYRDAEDFSANINYRGMPEPVRAAAVAAVAQSVHYPDPECRALREALAARENRLAGELWGGLGSSSAQSCTENTAALRKDAQEADGTANFLCLTAGDRQQPDAQPDSAQSLSPERILCGNGAAELMFALAAAYRPEQALLAVPSFFEYEQALTAFGCQIARFRLKAEEEFAVGGEFIETAARFVRGELSAEEAGTCARSDYYTDSEASAAGTIFTDSEASAAGTVFTDSEASAAGMVFTGSEASAAVAVFTGSEASAKGTSFAGKAGISSGKVGCTDFLESATAQGAGREASGTGSLRTREPERARRMIILGNPNNPTGRLLDAVILSRLIRLCRENQALLVLDESFLDFLSAGDRRKTFSGVCRLTDNPYLFVIRSFTKIYAMPGLRFGYGLCGDTALLAGMRALLQPWNVSVVAQAAAQAAAQEDDFAKETAERIAGYRAQLAAQLKDCGCRVFPSNANFLLFRGAEKLQEQCLRHGILIRDCGNFPGLLRAGDGIGYFRVCVRSPEENARLLEAVRRAVQE